MGSYRFPFSVFGIRVPLWVPIGSCIGSYMVPIWVLIFGCRFWALGFYKFISVPIASRFRFSGSNGLLFGFLYGFLFGFLFRFLYVSLYGTLYAFLYGFLDVLLYGFFYGFRCVPISVSIGSRFGFLFSGSKGLLHDFLYAFLWVTTLVPLWAILAAIWVLTWYPNMGSYMDSGFLRVPN